MLLAHAYLTEYFGLGSQRVKSLHAGEFFMLFLSSADFFFKINFLKNVFHEPYWDVKQFGSRSGSTYCQS